MLEYYTVERILETWIRTEAAGINTIITNNETPHVLEALQVYLVKGGALQWIAQVNSRNHPDMFAAIDEAVDIGCKALYFHGMLTDDLHSGKDEKTLRDWCDHARSYGIPVGVAGHAPAVHLWVDSLDIVDFHAVCFFNCGSLHDGKGERFRLSDVAPAIQCIRSINKPCIAYKVMGAGRIDPHMALEHALEGIKHTDVVNVGMHRGDRDDMIEKNVAIVSEILGDS
jgi:hypothetical protein